MQRYIAFLRAINVGGHNVKMAHLRTLFEELEVANVATFIASGNVIFDAPEDARTLETRIETHLKQSLGYAVATFLRTPAELAAVATYQPFPAEDLALAGSSLYVSFLAEPPAEAAQQKVLALQTPIDAFHVCGRELYWYCRTRISESTVFDRTSLEKTLGMPATMRNITTVRKLAAKYPPV